MAPLHADPSFATSFVNPRRQTVAGLAGLLLVLILNLFAASENDAWFSRNWWRIWFPAYAIWLALIVIGLASHFKNPPPR